MMGKGYRAAIAILALACVVLFVASAGAQMAGSDQGTRSDQGTQMRGGASGSMGQTGASALPPGITPKSIDRKGVDKAFASLTETALTRGKFEDVADHFDSPARDRIKQAKLNTDDLDRVIDQFRSQWQAKYNQDFKIRDRDQVYNEQFFSVTGGTVADPAQVTNWPVSPTGQQGMSSQPGAGQQPTGGMHIEKGRDIAIAALPSTGGEAPLHVSLVHQMLGGWKFVIPDNVTAQDLKSNLIRCITDLTQKASQWPQDPNTAYREVTRQVVAACYGTQSQAGQGSMPGAGTSGSQSGTGMQGTQPQGSQGTQSQGSQSY